MFISLARSMPVWDDGDYITIRATLSESVRRLARAGADFFVCPKMEDLARRHKGAPMRRRPGRFQAASRETNTCEAPQNIGPPSAAVLAV